MAHAGLNHARALAHAANADGGRAQFELHRDLLGPRVAGHDGFDGVRGRSPARNPAAPRLASIPLWTFFIGSATPMRPVEATSTCPAGTGKRGGGNPGHVSGVAKAALAGAGVGVAGIDDDRREPRRVRRGQYKV